jgi:tripartite-type tricarboxylate transporter receptor subunit TctC
MKTLKGGKGMSGMTVLKRSITVIAICVLALGSFTAFAADDYPRRNVILVVPFGAGGSTDTLARVLSPALQEHLGAPVAVENVVGAGARIGYSKVYRADPDGYTLVAVDQPTMQIGEITGGQFETLRFAKIYGLTARSHALTVRYDHKANSVEEFLTYYKDKKPNVAVAGLATANELQVHLMNQAMGLNMKSVPFGGAANQLAALLGKQVDIAVPSLSNAVPMHKDKKVKILAVLLDNRNPMLPDVPTLKESGYPEGYVTATTGIMGPPDLPGHIVEVVENAVAKAVEDEKFLSWVKKTGTIVNLKDSSEYTQATESMFKKIKNYTDIFQKQ